MKQQADGNPVLQGGNHVADFVVVEHLVEPGFFDVEQFAADRQDGLERAIAGLFRRATGGITFDDVEFAQFRIALRAIRELTG